MGTFIQLMTLTFSLVVVSRTSATSADPVHDEKAMENLIRSVLKELCPGANVCLNNQTSTGVPNESSCCTACSCEEECEDVGNCCFERKNSGKERRDFEGECVFPTVPQPVGQNRIYHQSYRMIADVPRYDERGKRIFDKCGDEKVAAWGSFFPVFSKTTKKIYKNMACADAANVTDGETWAALLACDHSQDAFRLIYELNLDTVPDHCEIQFRYLQEQSDLTPLSCFENLIDSCDRTHFPVPNVLPFSKEVISKACSSGFISPFRQFDMYANVFCHICNGEGLIKQHNCGQTTHIRGPNAGNGFFSLLDSHLMTREFQKPMKRINVPLACSSHIGDEGFAHCRTVYCPLGQIRNERGKCVFMMKKLYTQKCSIFVKLTANISFPINDTFNRSVWVAATDVSHLSHKWPSKWLISNVFYEKENKYSDVTNSLVVEMLNKSPIIDLRGLLTNIKAYLQKQWTLKLANGTFIEMSAHFFDRFTPFRYNVSEFTRISTVWKNVTFPVHDVLYLMGFVERGNPFPITRLYYCEQVELSTHEFELYKGVLFNKITNRPHFPGEFTMSTSVNVSVQYPVRICIQDSGFRKRDGTYIVNGSGIVSAGALLKIVFAFSSLFFN